MEEVVLVLIMSLMLYPAAYFLAGWVGAKERALPTLIIAMALWFLATFAYAKHLESFGVVANNRVLKDVYLMLPISYLAGLAALFVLCVKLIVRYLRRGRQGKRI